MQKGLIVIRTHPVLVRAVLKKINMAQWIADVLPDPVNLGLSLSSGGFFSEKFSDVAD